MHIWEKILCSWACVAYCQNCEPNSHALRAQTVVLRSDAMRAHSRIFKQMLILSCAPAAFYVMWYRNDMATWKSRGLRGSTLEDMINKTNEKYRENGLALIQKIPTPIGNRPRLKATWLLRCKKQLQLTITVMTLLCWLK